MAKELKYLLGYIIPVSAALSLYFAGWASFLGLLIAFGLLPLLELFMVGTEENLNPLEEEQFLKRRFFDFLLYINIPILYSVLYWYFSVMSAGGLFLYEYIGLSLSVGIVLGVTGINVAHELGHRTKKYEQTMAKILLLPNLYMHFFIEHNWGHHLNVSTDEDPASSRLNETIYAFFVRSVSNSYLSAWEIENKRLMRTGKKVISLHNEMIWYQIIQIAYLFIVGWYFTWSVIPFAIIVATIGFLLLEAVNYIEHYGLRRRKLASGKYEIVQPWHSWNSNHVLGRIMLYELTRHSDHHYKATRKYQVLRHFDKSPQLPYGYPASIVLAFMPKIWFRMMNPRVQKFQENMPALNEG